MAPLTRAGNRKSDFDYPKKSTEAHFPERSLSPEQSRELMIPETRRAVSESRSFDGSYLEDEMASDYDGNDENMPPKMLSPDDAEEILHPLREAANRVGREVENFAAVLDRFNPLKAINKAENKAISFELLNEYKSISMKTVQRLRDRHGSGKKIRSKFRGFQIEGALDDEMDVDRDEYPQGETTAQDLERWEQEAHTWDLLHRLFDLREGDHKKETPKLNRFSSERDYWDAFLNSDNLAAERATVLDWLKSIAEEDGEDINVMVHDLQQQAERGDIINNGWLYTKLAVKKTKRNMTVNGVLDPKDPNVQKMHLDNKKAEVLITQLDPDAPCRQKLKLEPEDIYFERAIWLGCYEMLRRGTDREKIKEWCEERSEVWRAVSMSGLPATNQDRNVSSDQTSIALWRRMCYANAIRPDAETYEKAVYGILSGDLASVKAVSKTWDDLLFAHYNSLLTSQFEHFLRSDANPDRKKLDALQVFRAFDSVQFHGGDQPGVAEKLVNSLKEHPESKGEAEKPMKMIQGVLIADDFRLFIEEQGLMLAHYANSGDDSSVLFPKPKLPEWMDVKKSQNYISLEDHDSLRVLTHVLLAFKSFGMDLGENDQLDAIENVIVAYINFLKLAGMEELIPTYAVQLSEERMYAVLGRTLIDVIQNEQRETLISLMQDLGIDVQRFVKWQTHCLMVDYFIAPPGYPAIEKVHIVGLHRKSKRVLPGFTDGQIDRIYLLLVRSFEWFLLVDGLWVETFETGALLYKLFYRIGNLAAAELLMTTMSSNKIASEKSALLCGASIDLETIEDIVKEDDFSELGDHEAFEDARKKRRILQYMLESAKQYKELELLEKALYAMDEFATQVELFESHNENKSRDVAPNWRRIINPLFHKALDSITPLLHNWLLSASSKAEPELQTLRLVYLPDIILGHLWILDFSGHLLTRSCLLKAMDLATVIADDEKVLGKLFADRGKMRELVRALAAVSQAVGRAGEQAKAGEGARRQWKEKGWWMGIWGVDFRKVEPTE